jgi:hypothetical protein
MSTASGITEFLRLFYTSPLDLSRLLVSNGGTMKILPVNLDDAFNGSFYTIIGAGGELSEWVDAYEKKLAEQDIGKPANWFTCKGKEVNDRFLLSGNNRFQNDLTFLFFPLDGLDVGKLAMFKLAMQDRWFDDVINNAR